MPTGYAGEGKRFSKKLGKWLKEEKTQVFDYDVIKQKSASLLVSFFRFYPDYFADLCRSEHAKYKLELPQRLMLRIDARYRDTYITGARGLTKTYIKLLGKMIKGILFPGIRIRYCAPNQKQAAQLATQAFHQIEIDYPIIASHWSIRNDRADMFRITTTYGSEFTMYAPRGDNSSEIVAEEIGAEGADGFDMEKYESDILPTCRLTRMVNQKIDTVCLNLQHTHIGNACSRQNRAYTVHRNKVMKAMLFGDKYDGFVIDVSYITALMGNLRDINYIKDQKATLTATAWLREMCARYTGTDENPMIADEVLAKSKRLMVMEEKHCGDPDAIYIVSHDVSYADGRKNAKCADAILKLTRFTSKAKADKYHKQFVYLDSYNPPANDYLQAQKLKKRWVGYCLNGGKITPLVNDAAAYGTAVVEELCKPSTDGTPTLRTMNNSPLFASIEQPKALPVIYPLKAGTRGATDADADMIIYAQTEIEQGNVDFLTTNVLDGVEAYKNFHNIKDNTADARIAIPYKNTELLFQQIGNLKTEVSGLTLKEKRKSQAIQRDIWSAVKYALRMAQILEADLKKEKYKAKSSWKDTIENALHGGSPMISGQAHSTRVDLLSLRVRK